MTEYRGTRQIWATKACYQRVHTAEKRAAREGRVAELLDAAEEAQTVEVGREWIRRIRAQLRAERVLTQPTLEPAAEPDADRQ